MAVFSHLKKSFFHLVYPPHCLHCGDRLSEELLLCPVCSSLLELIEIGERCPLCFGHDYSKAARRCGKCVHGEQIYYRMASAFEYRGPAVSLLQKLKDTDRAYLAEGLGAFLAVQFDRLQWPVPDAIVPVPLPASYWLERRDNPSTLLAKALASFLQVPVWDILKRERTDYSQAYLNSSQREKINYPLFILRTNQSIEDKTLLVLDDRMITGSTLNGCAKMLAGSYPARLYGLTVCCA